jgi:hypothetical protein
LPINSPVNSLQVATLRRLLTGIDLDDQVVEFATTLGAAPQPSGGLLVVGTPTHEPWHFVAHLAEEAAASRCAELAPTWVRWQPPTGGARHLAVGLDRLRHIDCHETILVIAQDPVPERLLDLVADGHKRGALVLALDRSDPDLVDLADEVLSVPVSAPVASFDLVQHVVTELAPGHRTSRTHVRDRLRDLLEARSPLRRRL